MKIWWNTCVKLPNRLQKAPLREAQTEISASVRACPTRKVRRERALSSSASATAKPVLPHKRWALNSNQWSTCRYHTNNIRKYKGWHNCLYHTYLSLLHRVGSIEAESWSNSSQVSTDGVAIVELNDTEWWRETVEKKQHNGKNTALWQHGERDEREMWPTLRHEAACLFLPPLIPSRCLLHALLPEGLLQATENLGFANQYMSRKRWMNYLNQCWYKLLAPERINSNNLLTGLWHKLVYDHKNVMRKTCQTGPTAFYHFSNSVLKLCILHINSLHSLKGYFKDLGTLNIINSHGKESSWLAWIPSSNAKPGCTIFGMTPP